MPRGIYKRTEKSNKNSFKHGGCKTPTYVSWCAMKARCRYNGQKYWHDKGVTFCSEWLVYKNFLNDMGEKPSEENGIRYSLDRIDTTKNYCKDNCRWATRYEQANNTSRNISIIFKGESHTLPEWSRLLGIKRSTLAQRIYVYGWSVDKSLSKLN